MAKTTRPIWAIHISVTDRAAGRITVAATRTCPGEPRWHRGMQFTLDPAVSAEREMKRIAAEIVACYRAELPAKALDETYARDKCSAAVLVAEIERLDALP